MMVQEEHYYLIVICFKNQSVYLRDLYFEMLKHNFKNLVPFLQCLYELLTPLF